MLEERFAIYCFSIEKTLFAPVRYPLGGGKPLKDLLTLGAWVQQMTHENSGSLPTQFPDVPAGFSPAILSYAKLAPLDTNRPIETFKENVFVVLMPGCAEKTDLKTLELVLDSRYRDYMKKQGIPAILDQKSILQLKPSFMGVGIDLKALWKKWFPSS